MRKTIIGAIIAGICQLAAADVLQLNDNAPERYVVKKGDTLWDISGVYLEKPWYWPRIWKVNPQIENPHLIYPGDVIALTWVDGEPVLSLERGRMVKLSPEIKVVPHDQAIPAVALSHVKAFLTHNRVVSQAELDAAPYVLAGKEGKIFSGNGDTFYARGVFEEGRNRFSVVRYGEPYIDPVTKEVLGIRAKDLGTARKVAEENGVATLETVRATQEIRLQDRLINANDDASVGNFFPSAPEQMTSGLILSIEGGVNSAGTLDVIAINLGSEHGIVRGHTLAIMATGDIIQDRIANQEVKLPDEKIGLAMVFRTFDKMSYALIMQGDRPVSVGDKVITP